MGWDQVAFSMDEENTAIAGVVAWSTTLFVPHVNKYSTVIILLIVMKSIKHE